MRNEIVTLNDLKAYAELKKHIREHMDDYDADDLEKSVLNVFIWDADREINALLDRLALERQKSTGAASNVLVFFAQHQ